MSDDGYIRIGADVGEAMAFFDGLSVNRRQIQKSLLRSVGQGAKSYVKRTMGSVVKSQTGKLKKTITYKVTRSGKSVIITNNAESENGTRYGFILAAGWKAPKAVDNSLFYAYQAKKASQGKVLGRPVTFKEQHNGLMTFKIGDKWIRTYHTQGKPRDFVEGPVERWTLTPDCHDRIETALQKQIDYWDKRIQAGYV